MSSDNRADPDRELDVALWATAELNRVIAAADAKVGLVLAAQSVVLAGAATTLRAGVLLPLAARVAALVSLVLASGSVVLLSAALWPRIHGHGLYRPTERLPTGTAEMAGPAWGRADILVDIVRCKYRWFRLALTGGTAGLLGLATTAAITAAA